MSRKTEDAPRHVPEGTARVLGHDHAFTAFRRAMQSGRLPHAWLLRGPAGIGKATLAFAFARELLAAPGEQPHDPKSAIFRMTAKGGHPDLHVLRRQPHPRTGKLQTEIVIDSVRAIIDSMRSTAALGARRVLLIDAVDELNRNAANALLKLLEEPSPGIVILLVCQRPGSIPRTILSRCAQVGLRALDIENFAAVMQEILPSLGMEEAGVLAELAQGSPGRALLLHEAGYVETYAEVLRLIADNGPAAQRALAVATLLEKLSAKRGVALGVDVLSQIVRRTSLTAAGRLPAHAVSGDETRDLKRLAAGQQLDRWASLWDKLSGLAPRVDGLNLDPRQTFFLAAHALCGGRSAGSST